MAYTFPSTPVLTGFAGSENPISEGGFWYFDTRLENSAGQKSSGVLNGSIADYYASVYTVTFGPECENYAIIPNWVQLVLLRIKLSQGNSNFNSSKDCPFGMMILLLSDIMVSILSNSLLPRK